MDKLGYVEGQDEDYSIDHPHIPNVSSSSVPVKFECEYCEYEIDASDY